jgi:hypothetical protein
LLPVCQLWPRTSRSGAACLVGFIDGRKLAIAPNPDWQADGDATHLLLMTVEAAALLSTSAFEQQERRSPVPSSRAAPRKRGNRSTRARKARAGGKSRIDDDPIPF